MPAYPKPVTSESMKRRLKIQRAGHTADVREAVFLRDDYQCRIRKDCRNPPELVHLKAKGMGGDHGRRTTTANCIAGCWAHHQGGVPSIHSGHITWEFLTDRGANGAMVFSFYEALPKADGLKGRQQ